MIERDDFQSHDDLKIVVAVVYDGIPLVEGRPPLGDIWSLQSQKHMSIQITVDDLS